MNQLPDDVVPYKHTRTFDQDSVPAGLLADHTTRAGVWGRLEVLEGALILRFSDRDVACDPEHPGVIPPRVPHCVVPTGSVRFRVVFLERRGNE